MRVTEQAAAQLEQDFVEEWSRRWLAAWNEHDAESIVCMCSEDVSVEEPALPEALHGRDGMRRFAAATFRAFPDVRIEELERAYRSASEPRVLAPYRFTGTMTGRWEFLDIAPTGARVDFFGIDRWEFSGELLSRYETLYDGLDMARQLGVIPAVGGRADRIAMRLQHLQARWQRRRAR